jgi:hypothetical protein
MHTPEIARFTTELAATLDGMLPSLHAMPELPQEQTTTFSPLEDVTVQQVGLPTPPLDSNYSLLSGTASRLTSIASAFEFSFNSPFQDLVPGIQSLSNSAVDILDGSKMTLGDLGFLGPEKASAVTRSCSITQSMSPVQGISLLPLAWPSNLATEFRSIGHHSDLFVLDDPITDQRLVDSAGTEMPVGDHHPATNSQTISWLSRVPNPRVTCIQYSQLKILPACIENARSMGLLGHDSSMPLCFPSSPFHRHVTPSDDPRKLLAGITLPSTPLNLKPTLPQVLYPHPAFMDLIPMPTFRSRVITLAATRPQLFDIWELKRDMFVDDGLVFWSNMNGNAGLGTGEGQGQPWDERSWEAAPWFLRKWRMLVDGEEGDVWKQSLWWQRARGEAEVE